MSLIIYKPYHIAKSIVIALMLQNNVENAGSLLLGLKVCFFVLTDGLLHGPVPVPPSGWAQGEIHLQHHPVPDPCQSEQQVWELKTLDAHSTDGIRESLVVITREHDCRVLFYGTCVYIGMQISNANVLPYLHKRCNQFKHNFWLLKRDVGKQQCNNKTCTFFLYFSLF